MVKNKMNFKLINWLIILGIIFMLTILSDVVFSFVSSVLTVIAPFLVGLTIAYALSPFENFMEEKNIKKPYSIIIIVILFIGIMALVSFLVIPVFFEQLQMLFNAFLSLIDNPNAGELTAFEEQLAGVLNNLIGVINNLVSEKAVSLINTSLNLVLFIFVALASSIYFLIDIEKIGKKFIDLVKIQNEKMAEFMQLLDKQMKLYFTGMGRIVIISFFEYTIVYALIGHPNAFLLGTLAGFSVLIPIFGQLIVNIIALITAIAIGGQFLLIKTIVVIVMLSIADSYIINPLVYNKTNKIHPTIILMAVYIGGSVAGMVGVALSLPVVILCIAGYKFFEEDINAKIEKTIFRKGKDSDTKTKGNK